MKIRGSCELGTTTRISAGVMPHVASAIFPSAKRMVTVVIMANLSHGCWQPNSKGLAKIQPVHTDFTLRTPSLEPIEPADCGTHPPPERGLYRKSYGSAGQLKC